MQRGEVVEGGSGPILVHCPVRDGAPTTLCELVADGATAMAVCTSACCAPTTPVAYGTQPRASFARGDEICPWKGEQEPSLAVEADAHMDQG